MSKQVEQAEHMGTKFLGFMLGMVLAAIYTVTKFFTPAFDPAKDVPVILYVWVIFIIVIPLLIFLAEIFWRFFHKYAEKFPISLTLPLKFWKLRALTLRYTPISR